MRVIVVTHHYLDINGGGSFASRAYINAFASIAEETLLLYPDNGNDITPYINSNIKKVGVRNRESSLGKLIDIYRGRINRFVNILFCETERFKPDVIVFDNSRTSAGYIKQIKSLGIRVITIHHNYEMEYYKGTKPHVLWRYPFLYYMEKTEREAVRYSDLNLTLTQQDITLLQEHYDKQRQAKFEVIGVFEYKHNDVCIIDPRSDKVSDKPVFAITGSLASYQTEISLIPFLEEYYPLLLDLYPDSSLLIAGRNPSPRLISICQKYPSVELIPNPKDMSTIMQRADAYICPVSVGGGLKLRVMDGLKVGLPVLAHEVSSRGYDNFQKAGYLFIYRDKETFILEVKKLMQAKLNTNSILVAYSQNFLFEEGSKRLHAILQKFNIFKL